MDAGLVNGRHFLNGMGLGFDAQVAAENYVAPDEVAKGSGKGKYIWHILKTLLFYQGMPGKHHFQGRKPGDGLLYQYHRQWPAFCRKFFSHSRSHCQ